MPYIKQKDRDALEYRTAETTGELNYCIHQECISYLVHAGQNYKAFNDVIGALECAKLEMYRRLVAEYEDEKIEENGDIYEIEEEE